MTISQDTPRYSSIAMNPAVTEGPTFSGADILGGIVAALMVLGPLTAAGTHASHQGWPTEQSTTR